MSEYQYYEFCKINSPMTSEERKEMAALSSRVQITSHGASYVYNYGDFRGYPKQLLLKYFDMFFYISNFGTLQLMFKYPVQQIAAEELDKYCIKHVIECEKYDEHVIVSVNITNEEGLGWVDGEGILPELLPLYDEIKNGDYQLLHLASLIHNEFTNESDILLTGTISKHKLSNAQNEFLRNLNLGFEFSN